MSRLCAVSGVKVTVGHVYHFSSKKNSYDDKVYMGAVVVIGSLSLACILKNPVPKAVRDHEASFLLVKESDHT